MSKELGSTSPPARALRVFMMDLWATVPYYTVYLSRALLEQNVDVQVGSITYYLDRECFRSRRIKLDPGAVDIVGRFPRLPKLLRRVFKLLESLLNLAALSIRFLFRPPDIIHVQFLPMLRTRVPVDLWFVSFCRRRGSKIVLTVHDLLPHDTADKFKDLYRALYARMDALICHSDHIKARLEREFGIDQAKISVIPHGPFFFDLPIEDSSSTLRQLGVEPSHKMVLWQGIIFPYKGLDLLLQAWRAVEQRSSDLCLVVLGTGDPTLTAGLEQQVHQLGLERVRLHFRFCSTEELVSAYRAATMVVYPYRAITTSGALATGLALGKTIVASDLPVFRELLTHGENGMLIDPHNSTELADSIILLGSDLQLRTQLEQRVRYMCFGSGSWQKIAVQTAALYRRVEQAAAG